MYSIADYATMMADAVRVNAYAAALRHLVKPTSVVIDVGAGTGTFALLACRFGARKVYAVEPDAAIHVGRAIAEASGLANRIEFVQATSTDVVLPDRADIVVSDIRGVLPLFGRHVRSIADARQRLLAEDGALVPRLDRLWAAVAEAPGVYEGHVAPWRGREYGLDFRPVRDMLSNTWRKVRLKPDQLLSDARQLAVLDYRELENPDLDVEAAFHMSRAGTGHGLCVWFDAELTDGIAFSNAPGEPEVIYGQGFFPFAAPIALGVGDAILVRLQADLVGDDYVWQWTVRPGERQTPNGVSAYVRQSTLNGVPLGVAWLRKGAASHVPALTTDGEIDLLILSRMQTATPLGEIASELLSRFPGALKDRNAALGRVGDLSRTYSRD
jgi:protein arginine N-methyltransferase 1